jgi:hypothetical protein
MSKEELQKTLDVAMTTSSLSKEQVLRESLRLFLSNYGTTTGPVHSVASRYDTLDAAKLLATAHMMSDSEEQLSVQAFTMDELLDAAFPTQVLLAEHDVKVWAGKLLAAAGYERRQVRRRGGLRPLVWERCHSVESFNIQP